jgi:hypothetical protein
MPRWYRLSMTVLILLMVWGCGRNSSLQGRTVDGKGQSLAEVNPQPVRFTKADNGVISDRVTGLDWYVGPSGDNTWRQAKAWTENLTVAGGGWRLPTRPELKALYQKGASRNNMDPIFQAPGAWVWSGEMDNAWSAWGFAFYSGLENSHGLDYAYGRLALAVRSRR